MNNEERIWKIYENTSSWIRHSDAKASVVMAIDGVLIGLSFSVITSYTIGSNGNNGTVYFLYTFFGFVIISILFAAASLFPRLRAKSTADLIYFRDILNKYKNPEEYGNAIDTLFTNESTLFVSQLTSQIWNISSVAKRKYVTVMASTIFLVLSMISGTFFVISVLGW